MNPTIPTVPQVTRALGRTRRQRAAKLADLVDPMGRIGPRFLAWVDGQDVELELDSHGAVAIQACTCGAPRCKHVDAAWLAIARDPDAFDYEIDDALVVDLRDSWDDDHELPDLPTTSLDPTRPAAGQSFTEHLERIEMNAVALAARQARLRPEQQDALIDWEDHSLLEPRAKALGVVMGEDVPVSGPDLVALVDRQGLGDLLDSSVHGLLADHLHGDVVTLSVWGGAAMHEAIRDAATSGRGSAYDRRMLSAFQQVWFQTWLDRQSFSQREQAILDTPAAGPLAPTIETFVQRYRQMTAELEAGAVASAHRDARYTLDAASGHIMMKPSTSAGCPSWDPTVTIHLIGEQAGTVRCGCPGAPPRGCATRAKALLDAIVLLRDPDAAGLNPQQLHEICSRPPWTQASDALIAAAGAPDAADDKQLGWELIFEHWGTLMVRPVLTRPFKTKPGWRCFRASDQDVASRLHTVHRPEDRVAFGAWMQGNEATLQAGPELLVDNPLLVHDKALVDVHEGRLTLRWAGGRQPGSLRPEVLLNGVVASRTLLRDIARRCLLGDGVTWTWSADRSLLVMRQDARLLRALAELPEDEDWPAEAFARIAPALPMLSRHIDIDLDDGVDVARESAQARPVLSLELTALGGLRLQIGIRAVAGGEILMPGRGPEQLWQDRDGLLMLERDFAEEQARTAALAERLGVDAEQARRGVVLRDAEQIAHAAAQAAEISLDDVEILWKGKPLQVAKASTADLTVSVSGRGAWLEIGARVQTEAGAIELLALREALRLGQRHVVIDKTRWLALADDLVERLRLLDDRAEQAEGALKVPRLMAEALLDAESAGATLRGNKGWRALREQIDAARRSQPAIPAGLRAELRPYQAEGVRWMLRRAAWSPGAVLADDMGLGKTVQALAVLLHRQAEGPALVVAPTSVGFGWLREAARFAPDLDVASYRGPDRASLLDDLGAGRVLVTSWDLLARDREQLCAVQWGTVVLDEAQAIKNPQTKRAKAARKLDAGFVLSLTGTPLENHVGELWSLMQVTVPGLLPGRQRFRERFENPIVRRNAPGAKASLARLVHPFLLRRTKGAVATDLPERIEIPVPVELGPTERNLYEAARLDAIDRIADGEDGRFHVLAALTRLRQLACHPRLVLDSAGPDSAKLDTLRELLRELREGDHKALVFSQFTSHLAIVRAALERDGLRICYLDGSTPAEERQRQVDSFQRGGADVFLISLKAGGTGLTLTAATYVFHLDPWWNPAVENQATDRAHRIGQTEPVTVYRLVAQDTVEEHIVALHDRKRALADALISGADGGASLGVDELVAIIRGEEIAPGEHRAPAPAPVPQLAVETQAAEPDAPAPQAAIAERADTTTEDSVDDPLSGWLDRFRQHIDEQLHSQAIQKPLTARNYRLAAENLVAFVRATDRRVCAAADLTTAFADYAEALQAGRSPVGRRTDLVFGKPAINRWRRLLESAER